MMVINMRYMKLIGERLLAVVLLLVVLTSCEENEGPVFTDEAITFERTSSVITESSTDELKIVVYSAGGSGSSALTFGGTAVEGVDFTLMSGSTVDFSSSFSDTVRIQTIDNLDSDGTRTIELTLVDGGFPGGIEGDVHTVSIDDDDCAFDLAVFSGDYNLDDPGNPFTGGGEYPVILSSEGTVENRINVEGILDLSQFGLSNRTFFMDLNPDLNNPSVTVPTQLLTPQVTSSGAPIGITSTDAGTYVSCSGAITVEVQILAFDAGGTTVVGAFTAPYTLSFNK